MSAVSNSVMPRSSALWMTFREVSRSVRWPKLLQPSPTAETRKPERPRLRICMELSCDKREGAHCGARDRLSQAAILRAKSCDGRWEALRSAKTPDAEKSACQKSAAPVRRGD